MVGYVGEEGVISFGEGGPVNDDSLWVASTYVGGDLSFKTGRDDEGSVACHSVELPAVEYSGYLSASEVTIKATFKHVSASIFHIYYPW